MKPKKTLAGFKSQLPLLAIVVSLSCPQAFAADITWGGGTGAYNVGSSWTGGNVPGTADRPVINAGTVQVTGATPNWTINGGINIGGTGTMSQSGATVATSGEIWIGQGTGGNGTYDMSGGTLNASNWLAMGRASGTGTLNLSGGTINKTNGNGNMVLGSGLNAVGIINQTGGILNSTSSATWMAEQSNLAGGSGDGSGSATWNLSGTGVANLSYLTMGRSGNGSATFNLNGGTLAVDRIGTDAAAVTSTFNFNGGTLRARQTNATFLQGITSASIKSGGAVIDSNGFAVTIAQNLLDGDVGGNGDTLTKKSSGALVLTGTGSTFTGNIDVQGGALVARTTAALPGWNTPGRVSVKSGGALGITFGSVSLSDFNTMLDAADMQAGSSVAIDTFAGPITYTEDVSALNTGLGSAIGFHKVGSNDLTLNMDVQTFTGGIASQQGTLILTNSSARSYSALYGAATISLQGNGNKTITGDPSITGGATLGSLVKNGTGSLTLAATGLTTTGNFVTSGGQINLNGGTFNVGGEAQIGQGAGANSTLKINTGDTMIVNNWLAVGRGGGTGVVDMTGGSLTKQGGGSFFVGGRDGGQSTGTFNQSGGAVTVATGEFWVGQNANDATNKSTGIFNLSGGTFTANNWVAIAREGANGTLNITGGTFTKQGANHTEIGGSGVNGAFGAVNVSAGTFDILTGETRIGLSTAGQGTLTVSGTGVANMGAVVLSAGSNGHGTINLDGGTTSVTKISKLGSGNGIVNFNGGVLRAKASDATFMQGLTSANVKAGGAKIHTNGFDITVAQPLLNGGGGGGLTKQGTGKLTLTGNNTYTGATSVEQGTLAIGNVNSINTSTSINVAAGATLDVSAVSYTLLAGQSLSGSGTVAGGMSIAGTLSPGNSPGTLSTGSQTWLNGGDYNFQMLNATGTAGSGWDLISLTGTLDLSSLTAGGFNINLWTLASISPDVNGSAMNFDPDQSYSWVIASATGGITGFDAGDFVLNMGANNGTAGWANPTGAGSFVLTNTGNNLILSFEGIPEPGSVALVLVSGLACLRRRRTA